jgi:hypothetical protein
MRLVGALLVLSPLLLASARKEPIVHDVNALKSTRIIGGSEAEDGRYPYAGETIGYFTISLSIIHQIQTRCSLHVTNDSLCSDGRRTLLWGDFNCKRCGSDSSSKFCSR